MAGSQTFGKFKTFLAMLLFTITTNEYNSFCMQSIYIKHNSVCKMVSYFIRMKSILLSYDAVFNLSLSCFLS